MPTDAGSRKTLIYLILTLNHMYPDWDFSNLRAHVRIPALFCAACETAMRCRGMRADVSPRIRCRTTQHFTKEDGFAGTRRNIDALLLEPARLWAGVAAAGGAPAPAHALDALWSRLDEVIQARRMRTRGRASAVLSADASAPASSSLRSLRTATCTATRATRRATRLR